MKIEIELTEYDTVGSTGKSLKLRPASLDNDVCLELIDNNESKIIVVDHRDLRKALDKIAL